MPRTGPVTPTGRERALRNLKPFRQGYRKTATYRVPAPEAVAAKRAELEAVLAADMAGWFRHSLAHTRINRSPC
jgi:hypothetical protein